MLSLSLSLYVPFLVLLFCWVDLDWHCQARSQAEAMKPGLQHKFGNLTLFLPQMFSEDIKWAGPQNFL